MVICCDFDGTAVTHDYPHIGKDIGAVPVLKELIDAGHKLILFTMRSGIELEEAVQWFKDNDIRLYGVNKNPTQATWTTSPKAYADLYIDDSAIGCPILYDENISSRPYIDWKKVRRILQLKGLLEREHLHPDFE
jgi:hypothetical protein